MGDSDIIEGFIVFGTTQVTVANLGHAVVLTLKGRDDQSELTLSIDQSKRLRRLLTAAERRAS